MNVTIPKDFSFDVNPLDYARELFTDEFMDDFYDEMTYDLVGLFIKEFRSECKYNFDFAFKGELNDEQKNELKAFIENKVNECLLRNVKYDKDLRDYTLNGMNSRISMWVGMNRSN